MISTPHAALVRDLTLDARKRAHAAFDQLWLSFAQCEELIAATLQHLAALTAARAAHFPPKGRTKWNARRKARKGRR